MATFVPVPISEARELAKTPYVVVRWRPDPTIDEKQQVALVKAADLPRAELESAA